MIIKGDLRLYNCKNLISLGKLKKVGGYLDLSYCKNLISLGQLEEVNDWIDLRYCKNLKDLSELERVDGEILLYDSSITKEYVREFKPNLLDKCDWDLYDF